MQKKSKYLGELGLNETSQSGLCQSKGHFIIWSSFFGAVKPFTAGKKCKKVQNICQIFKFSIFQSLLFSSCYLELAISENSGVFACYFHIYQAKYQLFTEITSSRWLERFCLLFSKFALYFRILDRFSPSAKNRPIHQKLGLVKYPYYCYFLYFF